MSTFYAGQRLRAADMNTQVRDAVNWAISAKTCRAVRNGAYSIPTGTGTFTSLPMNTEDFDVLAWHDGAGAFPSIVVPNLTGYFQVDASASFVADARGTYRAAFLRGKSFGAGPFLFASDTAQPTAAAPTALSVSTVMYMNGSTDYVELVLQHDAGAAISTTVTGVPNSSLCVTFIGT